MTVAGWIVLAFSALAGLIGAIVAWFAMSRALSVEDRMRQEASAALAKGRADFVGLAESVEEMIEEARNVRRRENGRKGGRPPAQPQNPELQNGEEAWTMESYRAHLDRTGRSLPQVERMLGL